jgi:hypothetical protein
MTDKPRDTSRKFAPKSETPRRIRSVNLTDDAWQWLVATAQKAGMSGNDYLEAVAEGDNPLMETVESQFLPFMETVRPETETDGANIGDNQIVKLLPFMEMVLSMVNLSK